MRRSAAGFSLIEVMVAIGVLAVGIGGVLAMFVTATVNHRRAVEDTTAAIIAESVIDEQRAFYNRAGRTSLSTPASGEITGFEKAPVPGYELYSVSVTPAICAYDAISVADKRPRSIQTYLEVRVHYMSQGREKDAVYRTVLFRE